MKVIICKCGCGREKKVKESDLKRGWGKFFSKSCKAIFQSRKTNIKNSHQIFVNSSQSE